MYTCGVYKHVMTYDKARTPNDCPSKQQSDNIIQFPQVPILENLYKSCVDLAWYIERPFTIRELVDHVNYHNKNSLWMLMEQLVKAGRIEKADVITENHYGQRYRAKVYFPIAGTTEEDQTAISGVLRSEVS